MWNSFKAEHGKAYTPSEELERFAIFHENLQFINEHNEKFARGEVSFEVGVNPFSDWTDAELARRNGFAPSAEVDSMETEVFVYPEGVSAPSSLDWRQKKYVTDVKDQGQCGSCWSFSTTGALEGQWAKAGKGLKSFSEQNLVDCDTSYDHGCNGGLPEKAYVYVEKNGIELEKDYPYTGHKGKCEFNKGKAVGSIKSWKRAPNKESELVNTLASVGPISIAIDASHRSFQMYKKGIYYEPSCSSYRLDHAVLLVGYGSEGGQDYWLVKNSWSTRWGESGYVKIARNKNNHCGVATQATYPLV
jgi:cathepsin L